MAQQHSNIIHGSIGKKDPFAPNNWALNYGPCNASFINSIGSCLPSWPRDCNGTWIKTHILVSIGSNQATRSSQFSHFLAYTYKNGLPTYPFCTAMQSIMDRNGAQPFIYVTNKCQMMPPCRLPPSNQCMLVEVKVSTGKPMSSASTMILLPLYTYLSQCSFMARDAATLAHHTIRAGPGVSPASPWAWATPLVGQPQGGNFLLLKKKKKV